MKKALLLLTIIFSFFTVLCCTTTKNEPVKEEIEITKVTVTGILKSSFNGFYIIENADSKSAVTISLTGTNGHEEELTKLINKDVTISGKLISEKSPWSKEIEFISIK